MRKVVFHLQQQRRERELRKQQEREQRRRYEEMEQLRREEERRHAEREQVTCDGEAGLVETLSYLCLNKVDTAEFTASLLKAVKASFLLCGASRL